MKISTSKRFSLTEFISKKLPSALAEGFYSLIGSSKQYFVFFIPSIMVILPTVPR